MENNSNKKVYMILGVLAIAGVAMYMMRKKDDTSALGEPTGGLMKVGAAVGSDMQYDDEEIFEEEARIYGSTIRIGNALSNGKYKWYAPARADIDKMDAGLEIGDEALINGNQTCTISDFWLNSSNKKAAFKCEEIEAGDYDIPGGSRLEY